MKTFKKIKRTSRRGFNIWNMFFTKNVANSIVEEANEIVKDINYKRLAKANQL